MVWKWKQDDHKKAETLLKSKGKRKKNGKLLQEEEVRGKKYDAEHEDEFLNITAEDWDNLQGTELYLLDTDKLKLG